MRTRTLVVDRGRPGGCARRRAAAARCRTCVRAGSAPAARCADALAAESGSRAGRSAGRSSSRAARLVELDPRGGPIAAAGDGCASARRRPEAAARGPRRRRARSQTPGPTAAQRRTPVRHERRRARARRRRPRDSVEAARGTSGRRAASTTRPGPEVVPADAASRRLPQGSCCGPACSSSAPAATPTRRPRRPRSTKACCWAPTAAP